MLTEQFLFHSPITHQQPICVQVKTTRCKSVSAAAVWSLVVLTSFVINVFGYFISGQHLHVSVYLVSFQSLPPLRYVLLMFDLLVSMRSP